MDPTAPFSWKRSSFCGAMACVEVSRAGANMVAVRDSKDESGPILMFQLDEWTSFIEGVKAGDYDYPG